MNNLKLFANSLLLPIALLPIAGILLRIGMPDLLNIKILVDAGNVVFINLPLLFGLGIATGLSKQNKGFATIACYIGYMIMTKIMLDINKNIDMGVMGGIIIGISSAVIYNKLHNVVLPSYLSFFSETKLVLIVVSILGLIYGIIFGYIWSPIQLKINQLGYVLINSGVIGVFFYGILNRLLTIPGLHHILNNLVWFVFGNYTIADGKVIHGDIPRFINGDPSAGIFTAGFFPIMMFGLPASCLAMYKNALKANKPIILGMLVSMSLTAFFTGITDPIELSFVFIAPILFIIHAILTGISMAVMYLLKVKLGFVFSAGFVDYVMFYKQSHNPLFLLPVGVVYFFIYFFIFDFYIRKYNLMTIGREKINI